MNQNRSTGNDIVSLRAIDPRRTCHASFYSKILSPSEQTLYLELPSPKMPFENFLWLLWSVKESTYKYCKRYLPTLVFSPTKIVVREIGFSDSPLFHSSSLDQPSSHTAFYGGSVLLGSDIFYFQSLIHTEFIAAVVNGTEDFENIRCGVRRISDCNPTLLLSEHQSFESRKLLLAELSTLLPAITPRICQEPHQPSGDFLRIEKTPEGYPVVFRGPEQIDTPVSLAHHDRFIAYSFAVPAR